jgi:hypothetical protein
MLMYCEKNSQELLENGAEKCRIASEQRVIRLHTYALFGSKE